MAHTLTAAHAFSMAADPEDHETAIATHEEALRRRAFSNGQESATGTEQETKEEEEDDDDSDDEPKLKHKRLTENLNTVYRNGDSTSSFMLAGDKMVCCF